MEPKHLETVEASLAMLSDTVAKATADLTAARLSLDNARVDIASHNTSVSRKVIGDAERVVQHLKDVDDGLRDLVRDLAER